MTAVVLFGIGSSIVIDVEESLSRAGAAIVAGISNRQVPSLLSERIRIVSSDQLPSELLEIPFLVPLFTPGHRYQAAQEAAKLGFIRPFTLIDPSVAVPHRLELGVGGYVNVGCSLGGGSVCGPFLFINRGASIGHHAQIGAYVSIGPGATISGKVKIGTGCMIGAGATILPRVTLGENSVVGAGAVVTRDVPPHCLVFGNPARIIRREIEGHHGLSVTCP
jgi:hypothetical protein